MNDVFNIDELVKHILLFVPKKSIGSCMLVSKRFYKMIDIEKDQDIVAKNEDFFSLSKIKYSPYAVMHIAKDNGNVDMMRYLLKKGYDKNDKTTMIGFIGDEELFKTIKFPNSYEESVQTSNFAIGLCGGMHIDLLEKYKNKVYISEDLKIMIFEAYKHGNQDMKNKLEEIEVYYDDMCNWGRFYRAKVSGVIARKDCNVKSIKDGLSLNTDFDMLCDALILGEHYDMFEWSMTKYKYVCRDYHILEYLIRKNNYKFFSKIFLDYFKDYKFGIRGKTIIGGYNLGGFMTLVEWCIEFRRVNILELVLNYTQFEKDVYCQFLEWANMLGFDDIGDVIHKKIDI